MPAELASTCSHTSLWFANYFCLEFLMGICNQPCRQPCHNSMPVNIATKLKTSPQWTPGSKSTFLSSYSTELLYLWDLILDSHMGFARTSQECYLSNMPIAMDDSDWHAIIQCHLCEDPLGCNQCYSLFMNHATTNFFLSPYLVRYHNCHMVVVVISWGSEEPCYLASTGSEWFPIWGSF
jgi:hypothetical protein